ncbi:carboxypeptidase-like regulatory domain-containing protein [Nonlabens ponticola]|uniref:Carboxypeptidase-like regulatory domain-containing protein n=1 Tax=Nonlabens ponticola TaxID=2496866 RepID=A0A3S9MWI6_9FLAO|nr:carboxypeptidase-like regulatory domain-containing protein [Nonlabens ponticola]AZQ43489.1 carboxypeptidase-like regulatory domain-containing protein [Nonlabens ponticola]
MRSSKHKSWLLFLFILGSAFAKAQSTTTTITGKIIDEITSEPLMGVAVYISGTSIGVVSGPDGDFSIEYSQEYNSPLVFSFLGYEKKQLADPVSFDTSIIKLSMQENDLEAVVINPDPWDRTTKERLFRETFIGLNSLEHTKILNMSQVRLRFNPETKQLTAWSNNPIRIYNEQLGYLIDYDLVEFELNFRKIPSDSQIQRSYDVEHAYRNYVQTSSYRAGSSFYQDAHDVDITKRKWRRRRNKAFRQSSLNLFRVISRETWEESKFKLFSKGFKVDPEKHIRSKKIVDGYQVAFRNKRYSVKDRSGHQTDFSLSTNYLYIDDYGNNLTSREIRLSGYIAKLGVGGMMPLDYEVIEK